jgi:hypothetical protein
MKMALLLVTALWWWSTLLMAKDGDVSSAIPTRGEEFLERAQVNSRPTHNKMAANLSTAVVERGQVGFVPVTQVWAGQREVSAENARTKLVEGAADYGLVLKGGNWQLPNDGGKSLLEIGDPLLVVRFKDRYVIVDGHHHAVMNAFVGGQTIPVKVLHDYSNMTELELWRTLMQERLVHLPDETPEQIAINRPTLAKLRDNPNRYLASILSAKAELSFKGGEIRVNDIKASNEALWVKINDGVPFVEFMIAAVLTRAGINYDPVWGTNVPREIVDRAREALLQARTRGDFPELDSIIMLESKIQAKKIRKDEDVLAELVLDFLNGHGISCSILNRQYAEAWARGAK